MNQQGLVSFSFNKFYDKFYIMKRESSCLLLG